MNMEITTLFQCVSRMTLPISTWIGKWGLKKPTVWEMLSRILRKAVKSRETNLAERIAWKKSNHNSESRYSTPWWRHRTSGGNSYRCRRRRTEILRTRNSHSWNEPEESHTKNRTRTTRLWTCCSVAILAQTILAQVRVWINCATHEVVFNGFSSFMKDTDHDACGNTFWKRSGSREHTRRLVRRWVRWICWMLPSSGSTEHVYGSIALFAKLYFSRCIQTLACLFQLSKRNCATMLLVFFDTELNFIAETEKEKTYKLSFEKHHHGRCWTLHCADYCTSQVSLASDLQNLRHFLHDLHVCDLHTCQTIRCHNLVLSNCWAQDGRTHGNFSLPRRPYDQRQVPTECCAHDGGTCLLTRLRVKEEFIKVEWAFPLRCIACSRTMSVSIQFERNHCTVLPIRYWCALSFASEMSPWNAVTRKLPVCKNRWAFRKIRSFRFWSGYTNKLLTLPVWWTRNFPVLLWRLMCQRSLFYFLPLKSVAGPCTTKSIRNRSLQGRWPWT